MASISLHPHCYSPEAAIYPGLYLATPSLLLARGSYTLASVSLHSNCSPPEAAIPWPLCRYTVTATRHRHLYPGLYLATPSLLLARGSYTLATVSPYPHCSPPEAVIPWPLSRYTLTAPSQEQLHPHCSQPRTATPSLLLARSSYCFIATCSRVTSNFHPYASHLSNNCQPDV